MVFRIKRIFDPEYPYPHMSREKLQQLQQDWNQSIRMWKIVAVVFFFYTAWHTAKENIGRSVLGGFFCITGIVCSRGRGQLRDIARYLQAKNPIPPRRARNFRCKLPTLQFLCVETIRATPKLASKTRTRRLVPCPIIDQILQRTSSRGHWRSFQLVAQMCKGAKRLDLRPFAEQLTEGSLAGILKCAPALEAIDLRGCARLNSQTWLHLKELGKTLQRVRADDNLWMSFPLQSAEELASFTALQEYRLGPRLKSYRLTSGRVRHLPTSHLRRLSLLGEELSIPELGPVCELIGRAPYLNAIEGLHCASSDKLATILAKTTLQSLSITIATARCLNECVEQFPKELPLRELTVLPPGESRLPSTWYKRYEALEVGTHYGDEHPIEDGLFTLLQRCGLLNSLTCAYWRFTDKQLAAFLKHCKALTSVTMTPMFASANQAITRLACQKTLKTVHLIKTYLSSRSPLRDLPSVISWEEFAVYECDIKHAIQLTTRDRMPSLQRLAVEIGYNLVASTAPITWRVAARELYVGQHCNYGYTVAKHFPQLRAVVGATYPAKPKDLPNEPSQFMHLEKVCLFVDEQTAFQSVLLRFPKLQRLNLKGMNRSLLQKLLPALPRQLQELELNVEFYDAYDLLEWASFSKGLMHYCPSLEKLIIDEADQLHPHIQAYRESYPFAIESRKTDWLR